MRYLANLISVLIGAFCIFIAVIAFNSVNNQQNQFGHGLSYELDQNYRNEIEKRQMLGAASGVVGGIFLIIGFIGFARRRNRKNKPINTKEVSSKNEESRLSKSLTDDKLARLEKLANLKEQGILTEDEFLEEKKKILDN